MCLKDMYGYYFRSKDFWVVNISSIAVQKVQL